MFHVSQFGLSGLLWPVLVFGDGCGLVMLLVSGGDVI